MTFSGAKRIAEADRTTFEGMFHYDDLAEGLSVRINRTVSFFEYYLRQDICQEEIVQITGDLRMPDSGSGPE